MMKPIKRRAATMLAGAFSVLACAGAFTFWAAHSDSLNPSAMQGGLECTYKVHNHRPDCYSDEGDLTCGYADYVIHAHSKECYNDKGEIICPLPEHKVHVHDNSCYRVIKDDVLDVTGGAIDVTGGAIDVTGGAIDVTGGAIDVTGGAIDVTGGAIDVTGGAIDATGGAIDATGGAITIDKRAEIIAKIIKYKKEIQEALKSEAGKEVKVSDITAVDNDSENSQTKVMAVNDEGIMALADEGSDAADSSHVHTDDCTLTFQVVACDEKDATDGSHVHTDDCYIYIKVYTCGGSENNDAGNEPGNSNGGNISDTPDVTGGAADVTGGAVDVTGGAVDVTGGAVGSEDHAHTDDCFVTVRVPICDYPDAEDGEHKFDDSNPATGDAVTGDAVNGGHVHTDECYVTIRIPVCEKGSDDAQVLVCKEPMLHTHAESCFTDGKWTCGALQLEEHVHDDACLKRGSDKPAPSTGPSVNPSPSDVPGTNNGDNNSTNPGTNNGDNNSTNPGLNNGGSADRVTNSWSNPYGSNSSSNLREDANGKYEVVKTGEDDQVILYMFIAISVISGCTFVVLKRKEHSERKNEA